MAITVIGPDSLSTGGAFADPACSVVGVVDFEHPANSTRMMATPIKRFRRVVSSLTRTVSRPSCRSEQRLDDREDGGGRGQREHGYADMRAVDVARQPTGDQVANDDAGEQHRGHADVLAVH